MAGFHLAGLYALLPAMHGSVLMTVFRHGNAGVDFFFVLSGFIIMLAHGKDIGRPERLTSYIRNRIVRVYPIYWLYTLGALLTVFVGLSAINVPHDAADWISVFSLVRLTHVKPPLGVAWTLFYEIGFYAIFAVLIFSRKAGIVALAVWFVVIAVVHSADSQDSIAGVWTSRLCINFFIGMAACWAHTRMNRWGAAACLSLGLAVLAVAFSTVDHGLPWPMFGSLVALACGVAIAGAAALERNQPWRIGPLAALGDASYTLYLAHVHIQSPLLKIALRTPLAKLPPDVLFVATLAITVLVSYGLYVLLEVRINSFFKRRARRAKVAAQSGILV